ncbi:hypothetical protein EV643_104257 [Kribbella sp. VKM Ac-2527]|uniref:Histidine kinase n=1 Tax=Kribbella caucasensis TaxID=2512215 RepID=A0A4R6KIK0_9ACTN|nr:hypothetical protein EV643_104257 [Kribbella sp. VKM Ac-2527]
MLLSVASALWPVEYADNALELPHPLTVPGYETVQDVWQVIAPACYLLFQIAWATAVVVRLRHAIGDDAHQLRWFAYAVTVSVLAMIAGIAVFRSPALGLLVVPVVPLVAGAAIVKYWLYDIDLVIHKTVVLGALAAVITAGYVGVVLVALAFEPVRQRARALADRLVYGDRPSPYEALARLSAEVGRLDRRADLFSVLAATVADAVGAAEVTVWVGSEDQLLAVASWPPREAGEPPLAAGATTLATVEDDERRRVRPIVHQGTLRGAVAITKKPARR